MLQLFHDNDKIKASTRHFQMIQFKNYQKGREFLKKNEPFIILWLNQSNHILLFFR